MRLFIAVLFCAHALAVESSVCGECHAEIYRNYSATPMAQTSGTVDSATAPLFKNEFTDANSGTRFRIERASQGTTVRFFKGEMEAQRSLDYYIGAGVIGRSYVSDLEGFLFQSPVAFYSSTKTWDLSPGFEASNHLNLTRPVEPACLNCHASSLRAVAGTQNGYSRPPFAEAGVSCERCHGPGDIHVSRMRTGDGKHGSGIVNPAKLAIAERESVCAQCHLVGVIRIATRDNAAKYVPGSRLFDSTSAFLWKNGNRELAANSHFEQLVRSACWRRSEGKLWCGTCHDPHKPAAVSQKAAYYRDRCLTCHATGAVGCSAAKGLRQAANDDCISCHMPPRTILTVQHAAQVDHTISRIPDKQQPAGQPQNAQLIPFPGSQAGDRELGLAYASEALPQNNRFWGSKATSLLQAAVAEHPDDVASVEQLAQLLDRMGREKVACDLFATAANDKNSGPAASVNAGNCEAARGDISAAMKSWAQALDRNPALEAARLNIAVALYRSGDEQGARANLRKALFYDPFSQRALELLKSMP